MKTFKPRLSGHFKIVVHKGDGVPIRTLEFDNIITDGGLEELGTFTTGFSALAFCHVGTGSGTPAAGDTALGAFVASVAANGSSFTAQASAPYYGSKITTYRFGAGAAAGNISEIGISSVSGSSRSLWSRALVLDGGGDPTTITVLSDEFLDVTYELRCYPPVNSDGTPIDVTGTVTIDGDDYDYTLRASVVNAAGDWAQHIGEPAVVGSGAGNLTAYTGSIGTVVQTPSGSILTSTPTFANLSYSANSLQRQMQATWGLDDANGNIGAVKFQTTYGTYQIGFSPVIPKNSTQVLEMVFQIAWARKDLP